jgi:hypothetical protein
VHKLFVIAIAGLAGSAACMGAAAAIGGKGTAGFDADGFTFFDLTPRCEVRPGVTAGYRTLDWDGSDSVSLAVSSHVRYQPGSDNRLHVSGDPQVAAHIHVQDGAIEMDCRGWRDRARELVITLPGRTFREFEIDGSGNLQLDKLDQASLKISVAGSGSVKANGHVDDLQVEMDGSGQADMGQVISRSARVEIQGSGNTDIAPIEAADIQIGGSGDVNLHSNPKKLESGIAGSGRIRNISSGG